MQITEGTTLETDQPGRAEQKTVLIAVLSLLGCGSLLAVSTNLAKVANGLGIEPLPFLTWSLACTTLLLSVVALFRGQRPSVNRRSIEYFVLAGLFSVAGSNLIFFNAVPRVGVSFVVLTISLPPVLTYVAALMLRMETFCTWRAAGVLLALIGTGFLVAAQWSAPDVDHFWIVLTLLGPVILAVGNIYRTLRWPPGASAESLAPGMLFGATALLILAALAMPAWSLAVPTWSSQALLLIPVQSVIFAGQFLLLFILQKAGGPVFLSLIGAVSAVIGVPLAVILLSESLLPALLPSALFIGAGIMSMIIGIRACSPKNVLKSLITGTPLNTDTQIPTPSEGTRFHLYLASGCPFCHRVIGTLAVTGLDSMVSYSWMRNIKGADGWELNPEDEAAFGKTYLSSSGLVSEHFVKFNGPR